MRRELDSLHEPDRQRVLRALRRLGQEPRPPGCEKLYDDVYRVRVGDWRVIYLIDAVNQRIDIGGIRRRSERTYRGIDDLFT
ncbi:MAG: type II toxin-antitoxin system RelE/ParE family toxin [Dehalococcoidia bacterium]